MPRPTEKTARDEQELRIAKNLTDLERVILRRSPYDDGGTPWNNAHSSASARRLARLGLLEENPFAKRCYRITQAGERVLAHRRFLDRIRGL